MNDINLGQCLLGLTIVFFGIVIVGLAALVINMMGRRSKGISR